MAIDFKESVVHESHDMVVTQNEEGDELTVWQLIDTKLLTQKDIISDVALRKALRSEISMLERTGIVIEDTGYTKIYRPHMSVLIHRDVQETVDSILGLIRT